MITSIKSSKQRISIRHSLIKSSIQDYYLTYSLLDQLKRFLRKRDRPLAYINVKLFRQNIYRNSKYRINDFLEKPEIPEENQSGLRAKYSTVDHVFTLKFLIDELRYQKKKLLCYYVDFFISI